MILQSKIIVGSGNVVGTDWSEMFPELLVSIAIRLPSMEDFVAFRGVCTAWRTAATKDTLNKGLSKVPFLMLAERAGGSDDRQLYSLSWKTVWTTMSFPWFKNKRCMDVGFGWVVTVALQGGEVNLVKPFTGATIGLPNFTTFPGYSQNGVKVVESINLRRGILSADPSRTSEFVLMVLTPVAGLGYWRHGGTNWMMVDSPLPRILFWNIGYYKGRMFDIDYRGNMRMRDPSAAADFTKSDFIVKVDLRDELLIYKRPYFVESSSGELLLIFRSNVQYFEYGDNQFQTQFKVVRVDVVKGEYEIMEGIGKDAVFLGENAAVCVDADNFPGVVKPNRVYYTDDCFDLFWNPNAKHTQNNKGGGGRDMGIYNFEDGSIERFAVEGSLSYYCPPLWIFPPF